MTPRTLLRPNRARRPTSLLLILAGALSLSSCRAIAGIFRAGVWTGVLAILLLVIVIGLLARLLR